MFDLGLAQELPPVPAVVRHSLEVKEVEEVALLVDRLAQDEAVVLVYRRRLLAEDQWEAAGRSGAAKNLLRSRQILLAANPMRERQYNEGRNRQGPHANQ